VERARAHTHEHRYVCIIYGANDRPETQDDLIYSRHETFASSSVLLLSVFLVGRRLGDICAHKTDRLLVLSCCFTYNLFGRDLRRRADVEGTVTVRRRRCLGVFFFFCLFFFCFLADRVYAYPLRRRVRLGDRPDARVRKPRGTAKRRFRSSLFARRREKQYVRYYYVCVCVCSVSNVRERNICYGPKTFADGQTRARGRWSTDLETSHCLVGKPKIELEYAKQSLPIIVLNCSVFVRRRAAESDGRIPLKNATVKERPRFGGER